MNPGDRAAILPAMSDSKQPERKYDIVVFGATGFTGRLVAEYLAEVTGDGAGDDPEKPTIRWALAGRTRSKLEALRDELTRQYPACSSLGIITAELHDWATLVSLAQQTRVVLTTVGPYINDGDKVVYACIKGGADYVDITGEPEFVDLIIERYGDKARDSGVRIVNCCGFDSIPHDLGTYFTVKQLPADRPIEVEGFVKAKGTMSGGTWRSAVTAMGRLRDVRKQKAAKAAQRSGGRSAGRPGSTDSGHSVYAIWPRPGRRPELRGWVFPLPTIDGSIVRRSARSLQYGSLFGYAHYGITRKLSNVAMLGVGAGALFVLAQVGPIRNFLLERKQSGDGPDAAERARSFFEVTFIGKAGDASVITRVAGGDPGYGETAKMVSESALSLVLDRDRLPETSGILTPAEAFGDLLLDRLQKAGIVFEVVGSHR